MTIRIAHKEEYEHIRSFYHHLIDRMEGTTYRPGWEKGVYPSDEYLKGSVENGDLWVCESENNYLAAMIVNHESNDGYKNIKWTIDTEEHHVIVVHALGVLPACQGKGIAGIMVKKVIEIAKNTQQKAIRLDVLAGNLPAERLYRNHGFKYIDTLKMFYEDTGWTDFKLFEYVV